MGSVCSVVCGQSELRATLYTHIVIDLFSVCPEIKYLKFQFENNCCECAEEDGAGVF